VKKNILIMCATSGIGYTTALQLAAKKENLIILGRNKSSLDKLNSEIKIICGYSAESYCLDLCDRVSINNFQTSIDNKNFDLNGIVIITPRPDAGITNFPSEEYWINLFKVCFVKPLEILSTLMRKIQSRCSIVIVSGITSLQALTNHASPYSVLRMMWLGQAKCLSNSLGPKGIRVNTISPGGILTPTMIKNLSKKAKIERKKYNEIYLHSTDNIPLRKFAEPNQISSVIEFLLSDASDHLTGINIPCDGGFTQRY